MRPEETLGLPREGRRRSRCAQARLAGAPGGGLPAGRPAKGEAREPARRREGVSRGRRGGGRLRRRFRAASAHPVPGLGAALRLAQVLRPGVWFGHGPIMTGRPRVLSFRATEPSVALHAPIAALQEIAASRPAWARAVGSLSDFSVDIAIAAVSDLLIPNSARRLAAVVLRASVRDMDNPPSNPISLGLRSPRSPRWPTWNGWSDKS